MARPRQWAHTKNRAISSNGGSRKTRERWTLLPKKWHTSPALEAKGGAVPGSHRQVRIGAAPALLDSGLLPHLYPPVTPRNVCVQPRPARFDIGSLATQGRRLAPQTMAFVIERAYREGITDSEVLCACMIQKDADLSDRSQSSTATVTALRALVRQPKNPHLRTRQKPRNLRPCSRLLSGTSQWRH